MKVVKESTRKAIDMSSELIARFKPMLYENDTTLKPFIEAQLKAMGEKGISYTELWGQCEALTEQLKSLSNLK